MGHRLMGTCCTGEEALTLAIELEPDLVILETSLGGNLDGIQTAAALKKAGPVGIVFLTTCTDINVVARAKDEQPLGYWLKPIQEDALRIQLEIAIASLQSQTGSRRRDQSFSHTFQCLPDAVIVADLAGQVVFVNSAAAEMIGCSPDQALGRNLREVYTIHQPNGDAVDLLPAPDRPVFETRVLRLTPVVGESLLIEERTAAARDEFGGLDGTVILFQPRQQESALLVPNDIPLIPPAPDYAQPATPPLVDIVESISDPLMALDAQWRFTYINGSAAKLFKQSKKDLAGQSLWEVLPPSAHQSHYENFAKALLHHETVTCEMFLEETHLWFEARTYPFSNGLIILLKDITTKKIEAERMSRLDRLESLGLLARGFAHDFNNLLTVLLGHLSLAEMRFGGQPEKIVEIMTAKQATLQAQSLVQQLLTFARGGAPIKRIVSLAELVKAFFHNHPRVANINYFVDVQEDLPRVALDPNQVRRLLGNLVRNAEQATLQGGEVHVRCEAADNGTLFANENVSDSSSGLAGVILEVQDTGEGIHFDHLPHIFEPYFTTRKLENATGLGLTVCESIAKAHGGTISVNSQPGHGTKVRFFLPMDAEAYDTDVIGLGRAPESAPSATARILVLEDDHLVRALIVRGLQSQGYEVAESVEGNETVRLYQQSLLEGRPYELVVLDLSIPNGMGGLRTMEKLRVLDPGVLALVSSGYSDDPLMAQPAAYGFAAVLPKPYEPAELIRVVKSLIASRVKPEAEK